MNYRSRWQQRRRRDARRRFLVVAALLAVVIAIAATRRHQADRVWLHDFRFLRPVLFAASGDRLLCASPVGSAHCLNIKTGEPIWRAPLKASRGFCAPPAVTSSKAVYVNDNGTMTVVSCSTGDVLWQIGTARPMRCSPVIYHGIIYVGGDDGNVYALRLRDGMELWRRDVGAPISSSVMPSAGTLIFGTADGRILGLRAANGKPASWRHKTVGDALHGDPVALSEGVAIGADNGRVYFIEPKLGEMAASIALPGSGLVRTAALADDGAIYSATTDGWVAAYSRAAAAGGPAGVRRWARRIGKEVSAGPVMDADYIYCGNGTRYVLALSKATGRPVQRWKCPATARGSLLVESGLLIASTAAGQVVAFRAPAL